MKNLFSGGLLSLLILSGCGQIDNSQDDISELLGYYKFGETWDRSTIYVCFTDQSDATAAEKDHIETVVQNSWEKTIAMNFIFADECQSYHDIRIHADSEVIRGRAANTGKKIRDSKTINAFLADSKGKEIEVKRDGNLSLITSGTNQRHADSTIIHEFGHALGFVHEHERTDSTTCEKEKEKVPVSGSKYGSYDPNSVMNYCSGNPTSLSGGDIATAQFLYGPAVGKIELNTDRIGGDFKNLYTFSHTDCEETCRSNASCTSWSFVPKGRHPSFNNANNICYLKNQIKYPTKQAFVTSGVVFKSKKSMSPLFQKIDYPGNDYRNFLTSDSYYACENQCAIESKCKAWTFVKAGVQHPTLAQCWLKSKFDAQTGKTNANTTSGVRIY